MNKSHTATEYMIIIFVVIVVALIIWVMGGFKVQPPEQDPYKYSDDVKFECKEIRTEEVAEKQQVCNCVVTDYDNPNISSVSIDYPTDVCHGGYFRIAGTKCDIINRAVLVNKTVGCKEYKVIDK